MQNFERGGAAVFSNKTDCLFVSQMNTHIKGNQYTVPLVESGVTDIGYYITVDTVVLTGLICDNRR
jgi:hypothetical protein